MTEHTPAVPPATGDAVADPTATPRPAGGVPRPAPIPATPGRRPDASGWAAGGSGVPE